MAHLHFASGSNRPSDIRGFAAIGHAIGVAAQELSENAIRELCSLGGTGVQVFVDSGAFSEIEFTAAGPVVTRPITLDGWQMRFALWERLAECLGSQLYIVAPDRIGDQAHTLSLLERFSMKLARLQALGANLLVPMQRGALTQAQFHELVSGILPCTFIPAIPAKKNATSIEEVQSFCESVHPSRLHLLGMGPANRQAARMLATIETASAGCVVSLDSNRIAANVGRKPRPRKLTAARDKARELLAAGLHPGRSIGELGIMLAFGGSL